MTVPLTTGQKAVTESAAALTDNAINVETIILKALSSNTADVYFGVQGVTTSTGYPLSPGEESQISPANENLKRTPKPSEIYVIGVSGNDVAWIATPR